MREELYQQTILEHNRNPRNFKKLEGATHVAEGYNPLCGDHLWVYMKINGGVIEEASFEGSGCAISKASASMMTASLKGRTMAEAQVLFDEFHQLVIGELKPDERPHHLGKLAVFSGIWQYPARVKCASLGWHTMHGALEKTKSVSTE
ncbi:MAG: SUF system NifU family Fe-S cluster assembly protein [Candidatus Omnitrophica bacterium]|nr:SUF system NifU family Fe-S cluster assembly protein [Candidatus Omnitrophota bacterium]MDE2009360.1 SUF system NifU family Fe-S cluster assembly protein [Candidatus Omnitrophota bacterium]MDE2214144.1 SUF system NifU family Fe-S cluster assembly protein [Candidatus Omnitrophota bacterium]MDE2231181.1 SUF system NifU family Fe-S cluster assembly protein [Candidatus Omnitrophota bacterium]